MGVVYLKRVRVAFSKFNQGAVFSPGKPPRYKGSFYIEQNSKEHSDIFHAVKMLLDPSTVTDDMVNQLLSTQLKADPEWADKQKDIDPAKVLFLWASSNYRPVISTFLNNDYIQLKRPKEGQEENADDIEPHLIVYGGDVVSAQLRVEYFSNYGNLGIWPQSIHIIEHNQAKFGSPEWKEHIEELRAEQSIQEQEEQVEEQPPTPKFTSPPKPVKQNLTPTQQVVAKPSAPPKEVPKPATKKKASVTTNTSYTVPKMEEPKEIKFNIKED